MSALDVQEGGDHYKNMEIQPFEFITRNKIPFAEGCVIKRMCRWRKKAGLEDLRKAIHEIQLMIELEEQARGRGKSLDAAIAAVKAHSIPREEALARDSCSNPLVPLSEMPRPGTWVKGSWVSVAGGPPQWVENDDATGCRHG